MHEDSFFRCRSFDHVPRGRGKGVGVFSLSSKEPPLSKHKIGKDLYQMMSFIDNQFHPYQLVIIYASSGCPFKELAKDLEKLLQPEMTTLIVGDFNSDKNETNALSSFLQQKEFTQLVNWPTHRGGRTIDHCYVSKKSRVQVVRHSPYYSDHDALCIQFEHFPW